MEYQYLSGEAKGTGILLPTLPEAPDATAIQVISHSLPLRYCVSVVATCALTQVSL